MRNILCIISISICSALAAQSGSSFVQDFGKVKEWNNPVYEVVYTNTSSRDLLFLPTPYRQDISVKFAKNKLSPGESTTITLQYFTEDFGRFSKDVQVYVSTENTPLVFTLKGNIQSFHPDALTFCPSVENNNSAQTTFFNHTLKVVDLQTNEPLSDFEIDIRTHASQERIVSNKPILVIKREMPNLYTFTVDKEGYEPKTVETYVNRNTPETVIALVRELPILTDEPLANTPKHTDSSPKKDTDILTEAAPEPVLAIEEPTVTPAPKIDDVQENIPENNVVVTTPKDLSDLAPDGKLNSTKYAYNNIVFLIDVSTSMKNADKLPLLKQSMHQMIAILRPEDKVSILTYSSKVEVIAKDVSGADKVQLAALIDLLQARGQSYGQEGVDMAYSFAKDLFITDGNNEIILASDGLFNSKNFKEEKIYRQALIQNKAYKIRISTIGFGTTTKALEFLETLAAKGDGSFITIASEQQASTILIENLKKHSQRTQ